MTEAEKNLILDAILEQLDENPFCEIGLWADGYRELLEEYRKQRNQRGTE